MTITMRFQVKCAPCTYSNTYSAVHVAKWCTGESMRRIVAAELRRLRSSGVRIAKLESFYPLY